jgi:hypothetical protein
MSYTTCPKIKPYKSNEEEEFKMSINQVMKQKLSEIKRSCIKNKLKE